MISLRSLVHSHDWVMATPMASPTWVKRCRCGEIRTHVPSDPLTITLEELLRVAHSNGATPEELEQLERTYRDRVL